MKPKPVDGKPALEEFTRTMKALFRVPKSEVQYGVNYLMCVKYIVADIRAHPAACKRWPGRSSSLRRPKRIGCGRRGSRIRNTAGWGRSAFSPARNRPDTDSASSSERPC